MSETWYPVIDYEKCTECGVCTTKCKHGVFNQMKAPTPVILFPEGCVHGCHGCGNLCPNGAISYVGDRSHTTKADDCGCGCSCTDDKSGCCN